MPINLQTDIFSLQKSIRSSLGVLCTEMEAESTAPQDSRRENLKDAGSVATEGNRAGRIAFGATSSRSGVGCTCSSQPGGTRCRRHGYMVPSNERLMRRSHGSKEILRRALSPPNRRLSLRWWNFRPTPSRLSNMSMA